MTFDGFYAAKKLAAELPEPLRQSLFDDIVLKKGFGCEREIMEKLQKAVNGNQRVIITYQKPEQETPETHELDPYHLFFRKRDKQ
ncbi:WYL domain-containing protein [Desulfonema limicola]|uniref:WYL domain-containing protein n=1 Tax=Desulfonema limicola TaxID=45656 RepID=UPI001A9B9414|nr:WYL domain-containing protein [Desulfonema limicola]